MRGGSLTRYHTPVVTTQEGKGLAEDLTKIAGPVIVQQAQAGLQDIQRGQSLADTWSNRGEQLKRGLKSKAPALAWKVGKHQAKKPLKTPIKEPPNAYGIFLVCESWCALEDFSKRKIAFNVTEPEAGLTRRIKLVGLSSASPPWRAIP